MMAFFLTMPISRMTPISAMMLNSVWNSSSASTAPDARRGQGREDGDGVDVALVENAEHDVDGGERREDQDRLVAQGLLIGARRALEAAMDGRGHADLVRGAADGRGRAC